MTEGLWIFNEGFGACQKCCVILQRPTAMLAAFPETLQDFVGATGKLQKSRWTKAWPARRGCENAWAVRWVFWDAEEHYGPRVRWGKRLATKTRWPILQCGQSWAAGSRGARSWALSGRRSAQSATSGWALASKARAFSSFTFWVELPSP